MCSCHLFTALPQTHSCGSPQPRQRGRDCGTSEIWRIRLAELMHFTHQSAWAEAETVFCFELSEGEMRARGGGASLLDAALPCGRKLFLKILLSSLWKPLGYHDAACNNSRPWFTRQLPADAGPCQQGVCSLIRCVRGGSEKGGRDVSIIHVGHTASVLLSQRSDHGVPSVPPRGLRSSSSLLLLLAALFWHTCF